MAAHEQGDQHLVDHFFLAHDDLAHFADNGFLRFLEPRDALLKAFGSVMF